MSPKKKKRAARSGVFIWFLLAVIGLLGLSGVAMVYQHAWIDLWDRVTGKAEYPAERNLSPESRLAEAIVLGARELGIPRERIRRNTGEDGLPHYELRCPDRLHPVTANRWLSRIFAGAGVEVLDCEEEGRLERPALLFHLASGAGGEARARLSLLPPEGQAPLNGRRPKLAIMIDDLGHNYGRVPRGLLDLGIPITASILPERRYSGRLEREARERGHAVFLHLPMEPLGYPDKDPGAGALFTSMSRDTILEILRGHRERFKRLDGFNNHMGSRATASDAVLAPLLDWAEAEGLLVVDSMTDARSKLYIEANRRGLPALRVDLYLDGEEEDEAQIMENIAIAAETARLRGWAIAICHPRAETLRALENMTPRLGDYGLDFVTLPELYGSLGGADPSPGDRAN